ncbi:MAG: SPOR domain-containing protein [Rhodobacteraceae bacterium]|nr:SPOR domain-containing protein [Paracoccaceae bacterium]
MHYVSIMLAFSAVIGLAIFRSLNLSAEAPLTDSAGLRDTVEEQKINNRVVHSQIGQLNKRVFALESELRAVRSANVSLKQTVQQLAVGRELTTASINPQSRKTAGPKSTRSQNNALSSSDLRGLDSGVGLHLATFRDPTTLSKGWSSLQSLEKGLLNGLSPFAKPVRSSTGGVLYKLIAGPIATKNEATLRCARLKTNKRFCEVSQDLGSPLAAALAKSKLPKLRASKP